MLLLHFLNGDASLFCDFRFFLKKHLFREASVLVKAVCSLLREFIDCLVVEFETVAGLL